MESRSAELLGPDGESAALVVGEAQTSVTELLAENAVLLAQVVDEQLLVAVDEGGDGDDEKLEGTPYCTSAALIRATASGRLPSTSSASSLRTR